MGDVTVAQEALPVSPAVTDEGWSRLRYADRICLTRKLALFVGPLLQAYSSLFQH